VSLNPPTAYGSYKLVNRATYKTWDQETEDNKAASEASYDMHGLQKYVPSISDALLFIATRVWSNVAGGRAIGMTLAADALENFLNNTGNTFTFDVTAMVNDNLVATELYKDNLNEMLEASEKMLSNNAQIEI